MTRSIVAKLIAKDLYFNRALIVGGTLAGLVTILLTIRFQVVGLITYVTVVVVLAIFLGLVPVTRERNEKSSLFVLSLPVSTMQYTVAKVLSATISFLIPWLILLLVPVTLVWLYPSPSANLPALVGIMSLVLTNFFILLTVGLITLSEKWIAGAIILTNLSVPLFFSRSGPDAVPGGWTPGLIGAFAVEAAIVATCLAVAFYVQSRRKDFV